MRSVQTIMNAIEQALLAKQWKKALSILEQGVVTLASAPPDGEYNPLTDETHLASIGLDARVLRVLETWSNITTVGQLQHVIREGKLETIASLGPVGVDQIHRALANYKPRRNTHNYGSDLDNLWDFR